MKKIIRKYDNGSIRTKYYLNHLNQRNGVYINYYSNRSIFWKTNYLNGKEIGLDNWYHNNKPVKISYYL